MVSIQYLAYFMKICETHSMNRAAAELFISQPALSLAVRKLEKELGVTLFVRSSRGIEPTEDGERLLRHSLLLMKQMSLIEDIAAGRPEPEILSISAFPYIVHPGIFAEIERDPSCASVRIEYEECRILNILENVDSMASQLGVIQFNNYQQKMIEQRIESYGLSMERLAETCWAVAVGPASPFYEREDVTLEELRTSRLIRMKDDLFSFVTAEIEIDGISLGEMGYDNIHSCTAAGYLLKETDSYMFCGMQVPFAEPAYSLRALPVRNCDVRIWVAVVRKRRHTLSAAEELFLKLLKEYLKGYNNIL